MALTRPPPPSFAPRGSRGWRASTSRIGAASTGGWSAGRQHFFGPPSGAHAAYLRAKGIID